MVDALKWLDGPQWGACLNRVVWLNAARVMGIVCISNALATEVGVLERGVVDG